MCICFSFICVMEFRLGFFLGGIVQWNSDCFFFVLGGTDEKLSHGRGDDRKVMDLLIS